MRYFLLSLVFILQINNVAGNNVSIPQKIRMPKTQTFYYYAENNTNTNKYFSYGYNFSTTVTNTETLTSNFYYVGTCSGLINMNARLYDPAVGRFLSPDPYVQAPNFSQNFNRYSYALNNPLIYSDPSGEFLLNYFLFHTNMGYKIQKMFSPVAVKFDLHTGSDLRGIGANASVGGSHLSPVSNRWHWGATYYDKYYDTGLSGWETRSGSEITITPYFSYSGTNYNFGELSQTTNTLVLGGPLVNFAYENDYRIKELSWIPGVPQGRSDKYRTAAFQFNILDMGLGFNLMTGDRGNESYKDIDGRDTYVLNDKGDPDKYRLGVLYIKTGALKLGWNSESIRNFYQNKLHEKKGEPIFRVLSLNKPFFYIGTGTGGKLW